MSIIPDTQPTWVVVRQGKPKKALELKEDWPVPKNLAPGQVLVRVQAAALNPVGWKIMTALPTFLSKRPHPAEHDFSGVVVDTNGSKFAEGDNVYGWVPPDLQSKTKEGVLTHYLRVHEDYIVKRPDNVTPTQAAGITLTAMTAYQGLAHAKLEAEQTILINGGSSAVGAFAIQIAKAKGAKVYTTASAKNEEWVRSLGADEACVQSSGLP
jgi:NADPH:quinone reductase-like Zn-dependent oxidoreductase